MLRFQKGDARAFQELYERYRKKLIHFCTRFMGNQQIAEELAQEVLIRVYRAAPGYRPAARFSTWIFTIATNVCLKERKKQVYRTPQVSLDAPPEPADDRRPMVLADTRNPGPQETVEARERIQRVQAALDGLPPHQKAALLLSTLEGFSYAEIAGQIGKSESSVKSLIHRARRSLAEALETERGEI